MVPAQHMTDHVCGEPGASLVRPGQLEDAKRIPTLVAGG